MCVTLPAAPQADGRLVCYCLSGESFRDLLGSQEEIWKFQHLQKVRPAVCGSQPCCV